MPASGRWGPQSQPNMQWALRRLAKPRMASLLPSAGLWAYFSRIHRVGEYSFTSSQFSPGFKMPATSNSKVRCMFSTWASSTPFRRMSATVSTPSKRSTWWGQSSTPAWGTKLAVYRKSFSIKARALSSLSRQKGSSSLPAASKSA